MSTHIPDENLYRLLVRPCISEKVTRVVDEHNQYVLRL